MQTKTMRLVVACLICATVLCVSGASVYWGWWPSMPTYTDKDNGSTVDVQKGTSFDLQLPENPTTGYQWEIVTSDGLEIISSEYVGDVPMMVGSGGKHTWRIRADKSGTQTVTGVCKQLWVGGTTDDSTKYTLNVRVPPMEDLSDFQGVS